MKKITVLFSIMLLVTLATPLARGVSPPDQESFTTCIQAPSFVQADATAIQFEVILTGVQSYDAEVVYPVSEGLIVLAFTQAAADDISPHTDALIYCVDDFTTTLTGSSMYQHWIPEIRDGFKNASPYNPPKLE